MLESDLLSSAEMLRHSNRTNGIKTFLSFEIRPQQCVNCCDFPPYSYLDY